MAEVTTDHLEKDVKRDFTEISQTSKVGKTRQIDISQPIQSLIIETILNKNFLQTFFIEKYIKFFSFLCFDLNAVTYFELK